MNSIDTRAPRRQSGMALIAAMLILLVITILGMAMFRSYGLQQIIGGNTREKAGALQSAMAAQNFAEWSMISNNGGNATAVTTCSSVQTWTTGIAMVCSNIIPSTVSQPDTWGGGFTYQMPGMNTTVGAQGSYSQYPVFYISNLKSQPYNGISTIALFQIDAAGWGSTPQSVAVVESAYSVMSTKTPYQPPSGSSIVVRNVFLGGP